MDMLSFKQFSAEYNEARAKNGKPAAGYLHRAILYIWFLDIISSSDRRRKRARS